MLGSYIALGLDPARFWELTPRLFSAEMAGAGERDRRQRELAWWGAMLPYMEKPVSLEVFVGRPLDRKSRVAAFHGAWDKIDRALDRTKRRN